MEPWRNWRHCIGTAYGAWLRGDRRGWRARHHREHVQGDYRNPPPKGMYDEIYERSRRLMKRDPVVFAMEVREVACRARVEALLHYNVELVDLAVGGKHYHALARFTPADEHGEKIPATGVAGLCGAHMRKDGLDPVPRYVLGKAHSWCSRIVKQHMRQSPGTPVPGTGGLWAPRPRVKPIADRAHQLRVAKYVRDHALKGAAVWSMMRQ